MKKIFRFNKGENVIEDDFRSIESAIRERTISIDDKEDDIMTQCAKENFEVIIKRWRKKNEDH